MVSRVIAMKLVSFASTFSLYSMVTGSVACGELVLSDHIGMAEMCNTNLRGSSACNLYSQVLKSGTFKYYLGFALCPKQMHF